MKLARLVKIVLIDTATGLSIVAVGAAIFSKDISDYLVRQGDKEGFYHVSAAITDYSLAIFFNHKNSLAYFRRAEVKLNTDNLDFDGALADLNKAIEISPNDTNAIKKRAEVKLGQHDADGALNDLSQAIKSKTYDSELYRLRGDAYSEKNDPIHAIADYTAAIDLFPEDSSSYNGRASVEYLSGRNSEALADMYKLIQLAPQKQDVARLFVWMIESESPGQQAAANQELSDWLKTETGQSYPWIKIVGPYLTGETNMADFLKSVDNDSALSNRKVFCFMLVGIRNALYGDKPTAVTYLQMSKKLMEGASKPNPFLEMWLKREQE